MKITLPHAAHRLVAEDIRRADTHPPFALALHIQIACQRKRPFLAWSAAELLTAWQDPSYTNWIVWLGDLPVAYLLEHRNPIVSTACLWLVHPSMRRQGIGTAMFYLLRRRLIAVRRFIDCTILEPKGAFDDPAFPFLASLGFQPKLQRGAIDGQDAYRYTYDRLARVPPGGAASASRERLRGVDSRRDAEERILRQPSQPG